MKIVFKHDGNLPVAQYGGTERILFWHMKELVRQGHEVTLVGRGKYQLTGTGIRWAESFPKSADVLHLCDNEKIDFGLPTVYALHGNGQPGEVFSENTVFLCQQHAARHNGEFYIPNALDLTEYPFEEPPAADWKSFLFLAKASWRVKNLAQCVRAVRKTRKTLLVAGGRYFWPSRRVRNFGMVDTKTKRKLLSQVSALLFPVRWHEPFGLAMIEAMAQGVPVIGSPFGSLTEIISEEAGVVCQDYAEFQEVVRERPRNFDSRAIRRVVEEKYAIEKHTRAFVGAYERVLAGEKLNSKQPKTLSAIRPEVLLPF